MKLFKNYKKLYKIEKENNKVLNERNIDLGERSIKYQEKIKELKEEVTKLKFDLEDTTGFLLQEKEVSKELRKERKTLRRKLTMQGKTLNDKQVQAVAYAIVQQAEAEHKTVQEIIDRIILEESLND